ncbi:MAG: hypothetical protein QOH80_977, partial [Actinomycetota bacterium]|nr:hypothetical protein [Actinomycetota bacterium]
MGRPSTLTVDVPAGDGLPVTVAGPAVSIGQFSDGSAG